MLKIALSGCNGRMGHVISDIVANKKDMEIVAGFDINTEKHAGFPVYADPFEFPGACDVIIDFSNASSTEHLLAYCEQHNTPIVICTTGHSPEQLQNIRTASAKFPIFRSGNMSIGINLMMELLRKSASVLGENYDVEIIEKHHNQKIDAPSGTALMLADAINESCGGKYSYVYDRHSVRKKRDSREIGIHSVRGGTIVGEHEIIFAGRDEVITLSHSAASKEVFAVGAVNAAAFVASKPAGLYSMADMI